MAIYKGRDGSIRATGKDAHNLVMSLMGKQDNPKHPLQWFVDRVGKKIIAKSPHAFNGEMEVKDLEHAKYLCNSAQEHQHYNFTDIPEVTK